MDSATERGVSWTAQLPATALVSGLLLRVGEERYVVPALQLTATGRVSAAELGGSPGAGEAHYEYGGRDYRIRPLSELLGIGRWLPSRSQASFPVVLVACGAQHLALVADEVIGPCDGVIEPLGAQLVGVPGIAGGTDVGDGGVTLVLDLVGLVRWERLSGPALRMDIEHSPRPALGAPLTVLLVEPSLTLRATLVRRLGEAGFRTITARNGIEGVQRLRDGPADVVVVDADLPGLDGDAFARRIRADRRWRHLPIVMTRWGREADAGERGADVVIDSCLTKPYPPSVLIESVRELIAPRSAP
jgi:chemosensory pili system protein ChpA (sensor histidine kinase/response regulator)